MNTSFEEPSVDPIIQPSQPRPPAWSPRCPGARTWPGDRRGRKVTGPPTPGSSGRVWLSVHPMMDTRTSRSITPIRSRCPKAIRCRWCKAGVYLLFHENRYTMFTTPGPYIGVILGSARVSHLQGPPGAVNMVYMFS